MKKILAPLLILSSSLLLGMKPEGSSTFSIKDLSKAGKIPAMKKQEAWVNGGKKELLTLDLAGQKISSLDGLTDIPKVKDVQQLNLNSNLLTTISGDDFKGLSKLVVLLLSNNKINSFDTATLDQLPSLRSLFLPANPLDVSYIGMLQLINRNVSIIFY